VATETASAADPCWQILGRVAAGEVEAFAALVERHEGRLLRLCERLLGSPEEARDAAQEVFLKVFRKAGAAEPRGQVSTWLYRIAVNHCLNQLRRRRLVRFLGLGGGEEGVLVDPPDEAPGPAAALEARRRWQEVRSAIARLPANQRSVLVLVRLEGLSYRETAEVLGITEGAVESRLVRAMRRLAAAQEGTSSSVSRRETP
jgi:RNA polymerase sigma-70 factor, ECF subfamily